MDFENFLVRKCPPTAMYIPNFITSAEEQLILSRIERTPKPKWTQLLNRRLINYGGVPHATGMVAEEIPDWLHAYIVKVNNLGVFETQKANHVLVNEYKAGQGIMPHCDGPIFYPIICTISCGSHTVLELSDRETVEGHREVRYKLLLEPRSLLILKDSLYTDYLHSIREIREDVFCDLISNYENCENSYRMGDSKERGTRISLTIRNVPKTTKFRLKFK